MILKRGLPIFSKPLVDISPWPSARPCWLANQTKFLLYLERNDPCTQLIVGARLPLSYGQMRSNRYRNPGARHSLLVDQTSKLNSVALRVGLEPTTHGLTVRCSTIWAIGESFKRLKQNPQAQRNSSHYRAYSHSRTQRDAFHQVLLNPVLTIKEICDLGIEGRNCTAFTQVMNLKTLRKSSISNKRPLSELLISYYFSVTLLSH